MNERPLRPLVGVVDDDDAVRLSIALLVETLECTVTDYADARALLEDPQGLERFDCLILDVRMPGLSGLAAQQKLLELGASVPIIFVTGHGDVPMVARAMRDGAFDFIQKPFNDQVLLERVQEAVLIGAARRAEGRRRSQVEARLATLSARERDVLQGMLAGRLNKQIAGDLGISMKTVEQHRARVMDKMQVNSLAELVRQVTEFMK